MSKNSLKPTENTNLHSVTPQEEPKSAHATPVTEKYVEKRKNKAEKQTEAEHDGITHAKQTKSVWDEWESYKYAIF